MFKKYPDPGAAPTSELGLAPPDAHCQPLRASISLSARSPAVRRHNPPCKSVIRPSRPTTGRSTCSERVQRCCAERQDVHIFGDILIGRCHSVLPASLGPLTRSGVSRTHAGDFFEFLSLSSSPWYRADSADLLDSRRHLLRQTMPASRTAQCVCVVAGLLSQLPAYL